MVWAGMGLDAMNGAHDANNSQAPPPEGPGSLRISTDDFPEADRLGFLREAVGKEMLRHEIEPLSDSPLFMRATIRPLAGLNILRAAASPVRFDRTRGFLSDGNDALLFQWTGSARLGENNGREVALGAGDAILFSCAETCSAAMTSPFETIGCFIPRNELEGLLRDADGCLARVIPANSSALKLLLGYLELLRDDASAPTPELQRLAVEHVYDLLALALGATRDAAETARKRGLSAARLHAIKGDIQRDLADGDLSVSALAAQHRVTPRYVQMLFENDGTTFTAFVRDARLARAHRMLANPRFGTRKIVDIAFACGFADVSFFNRKFRARYGATPSDVRNTSG